MAAEPSMIPATVVNQCGAALFGALLQHRLTLKPEAFGRALELLCMHVLEEGIDDSKALVSLIERLLRGRGAAES